MTQDATATPDAPATPTSADASSSTPPSVSSGDRWFMIALTVFEIGASIVTVEFVKSHGGSDFSAYMWSLLAPLVGGLVYWARTRHASGASASILAFNLLSAAVAFFGSHDSKVLLYKDCFVTGIIGLIFAGSLLLKKPLTFWFGQRFATGGTPQGLAWWDGLWRYPRFRSAHRLMTIVWALVMFVEAGVKAVVIANSSFQNAYAWTQIIPVAATLVGIAVTVMIARRLRLDGQRAAAQRGQ